MFRLPLTVGDNFKSSFVWIFSIFVREGQPNADEWKPQKKKKKKLSPTSARADAVATSKRGDTAEMRGDEAAELQRKLGELKDTPSGMFRVRSDSAKQAEHVLREMCFCNQTKRKNTCAQISKKKTRFQLRTVRLHSIERYVEGHNKCARYNGSSL